MEIIVKKKEILRKMQHNTNFNILEKLYRRLIFLIYYTPLIYTQKTKVISESEISEKI